jgi:hypothetical protein
VPAVVKIDKLRKIVISTFYGDVTGEELLRHGAKIQSDPDFNPAYSEIVDLSGVASFVVSEQTLASMANTRSLYQDEAIHIVIAPAEREFRMARNYQELARTTRPNFHVVRSLQQAYAVIETATAPESS